MENKNKIKSLDIDIFTNKDFEKVILWMYHDGNNYFTIVTDEVLNVNKEQAGETYLITIDTIEAIYHFYNSDIKFISRIKRKDEKERKNELPYKKTGIAIIISVMIMAIIILLIKLYLE